MRWSLGVSVLVMGVKVVVYLYTGSAAILGDAVESVVHLGAVGFVAYSLYLSHKPADSTHRYGHAKIGFFSSGLEGLLVASAGLFIFGVSVSKLWRPQPITAIALGTCLITFTIVTNGVLGWTLLRIGRKHRSIILEANGRHTLVDCWTSSAALLSLVLTWLTHWPAIDPVIGILVATNILIAGIRLIRNGLAGLMDSADPVVEKQIIRILNAETARRGLSYHNMRHRNMGDAYGIELHLVFPAGVLLSDAHRIATEIEQRLEAEIRPGAHITTHLESALDHDVLHQSGD